MLPTPDVPHSECRNPNCNSERVRPFKIPICNNALQFLKRIFKDIKWILLKMSNPILKCDLESVSITKIQRTRKDI